LIIVITLSFALFCRATFCRATKAPHSIPCGLSYGRVLPNVVGDTCQNGDHVAPIQADLTQRPRCGKPCARECLVLRRAAKLTVLRNSPILYGNHKRWHRSSCVAPDPS
jgi:hypothetical protein